MADEIVRRDRWRRYWDRQSTSYDRSMGLLDRVLFGDTRTWVCSKADGDTLEVGVGTGLNLPLYPAEVQLTGIDLSPAMLKIAQDRARNLERSVDLREADAHALPFPDHSFDTVVSTFSLCAIPDHHQAIREMTRVLRPGGRLLLADHIAGSGRVVRGIQHLLELISVPLGGEHFLRRPVHQVTAEGLAIEQRERFKLGVVERLAARKPDTA
jgi:ubiquinone/menaquinone biosynthesis C-methylase UbiE